MKEIDDNNNFKKKWWLHPLDPENIAELKPRDRQNAKSFNHWILVWAIMFFGIINVMEPLSGGIEATPAWRILLAFSPLISGIFLIRAFFRFLSETKDELIREIHYQALAVGFLLAFIIGMSFALTAVIIGASVNAGPLMFSGLLVGYFLSLGLQYRKYNV